MTRREQWALIGVVILIAAGLAFQAWHRFDSGGSVVYVPGQGRWEKVTEFSAGQRPAPPMAAQAATSATTAAPPAASGRASAPGLDLNLASAEELDRLPGIGASYARAILDLRARLGGFRSVDQLDDVSGLSAKTIERLRPYVMVGHPVPAAATPPAQAAVAPSTPAFSPSPAPPPMPARKEKTVKTQATPSPGAVVDVNRAGVESLENVKWIGPVLAQRIVEERRLHGPYLRPEDLARRVKGIGPRNLKKILPQIVIGPTGRD